MREIRRYIGILLTEVLEPADIAIKAREVALEKKRVQKLMQAILRDWDSECKDANLSNNTANRTLISELPQEYRHAQAELEEMEDEDSELTLGSDSDSDSDGADSDLGPLPVIVSTSPGEVDSARLEQRL
jgi:hypothetical protein